MDIEITQAMIIGITTGWVIANFSPTWQKFTQQIVAVIKPNSKLYFYMLNGLINLAGFVIVLVLLLLVVTWLV